MISFDLHAQDGVLVLRPEGALAAEDFRELADTVDPYLERNGELQGVMIDALNFPGWKDLSGLVSHIRFVKNHHERIRRLAVVSDDAFLVALPFFLRHFVDAEVRRFEADERKEAENWLCERKDKTENQGSLRFAEAEKGLFWIEVNGKVTRKDYLELLKTMKGRIAEEDATSYVIEIADLEGVELGAMWEDLKFGLSNLRNIKRVAVIGDQKWVAWVSARADSLSGVQVHAFHADEQRDAWEWVRAA